MTPRPVGGRKFDPMSRPSPETITHTTATGLSIVADQWPGERGRHVLLLHGGGQTRHAWTETAHSLALAGHRPVSVDLRGHGDSGWDPAGNYEVDAIAHDIASLCASLPDKPILVGASLGGLTGLVLEGSVAPGSIAALVLVDIVPRMNVDGADRIVAFMAERIDEGFESLEDVADAVTRFNPNRARPTELDGLRKNLRERNGRWFWHWDPAFIQAATGGSEDRLIRNPDMLSEILRRVDVPVMLVRGRRSDLVTDSEVAEFRAEFPNASFVDVAGAGHMVAGDRNDAFTTAVTDFIDTIVNAERNTHD